MIRIQMEDERRKLYISIKSYLHNFITRLNENDRNALLKILTGIKTIFYIIFMIIMICGIFINPIKRSYCKNVY